MHHGALVMALGAGAPLACAQSLALSEQAQQAWLPRFAVALESLSDSARPVASLLNDRFFFGGARLGRPDRVSGFRASGGLVAGAGSAWLGAAAASPQPVTVPGSRGTPPSALPSVLALGGVPPRLGQDLLLQPYLGIGYTHQADDGSWGLSADLGMAATGSETWQDWGRAVLGPSRLDEAVRNLKMRPVLQLGLRYRF
jgi:hypothetical protein